MKKITSPPALKKGDHIGLVMPAGPLSGEENFSHGIDILREHGYLVKHDNCHTMRQDYLAGSDKERAASFCRMWQDPEVKAVLAVRGGYGSIRMLPHIDLAMIRRQPKVFIGFSDITTLLNTFALQADLTSYHGPMLTTLGRCDQDSLDSFFTTLANPGQAKISARGIEIIVPGQARGRLLGGNLTILAHLLATPYDLDWQDSILLIEDIGEAPYRIDRILTQLHLAGKLDKLAGIIMGSFTDTAGKDMAGIELIQQRLLELTKGKMPIWAKFPSGHGSRNLTLPVGIRVEMDGAKGCLLPCAGQPINSAT